MELPALEASFSGSEGIAVGRRSIVQRFEGDLSAESRGEMLSAITAVQGSAGYVAIEQVSGTLGGRQGSFVLQHSGLMDRGQQRLLLEVLPDSGSGGLSGLRGSMEIRNEAGQHSYILTYELPD